jgi:hypothetical protein
MRTRWSDVLTVIKGAASPTREIWGRFKCYDSSGQIVYTAENGILSQSTTFVVPDGALEQSYNQLLTRDGKPIYASTSSVYLFIFGLKGVILIGGAAGNPNDRAFIRSGDLFIGEPRSPIYKYVVMSEGTIHGNAVWLLDERCE